MRWEKLAKPLEEFGKWFLNLALITIAGLIIQPIVKENASFVLEGTFLSIMFATIGFGLILILEKLAVKNV